MLAYIRILKWSHVLQMGRQADSVIKMSWEGLGDGYGCRHPRHHGRRSIFQGAPRLPSLQILTLEADVAEHLLIYFYCLRYVLQVLPKPLFPRHTSSRGLSESNVSVRARNCVS